MFTGIVDHTGKIQRILRAESSQTLSIGSKFTDLKQGESISVNGVCLTICKAAESAFDVEVSPETLKVTNLGELTNNQNVNLERAMMVGDRFGGHYVTGHVDSICRVTFVQNRGEFLELTLGGIEPHFRKYLHTKGSVSLNGVSLTVNSVRAQKSEFSILIIPHTLEQTNLNLLRVGSRLNIEFDWMAKVVIERLDERFQSRFSALENGSLSREFEDQFHKDRWVEDI